MIADDSRIVKQADELLLPLRTAYVRGSVANLHAT